MRLLLPLLLAACDDQDQGLYVYPADTGRRPGGGGGGGGGETEEDSGSPADEPTGPRAPRPGDLLVSELMIDPAAVPEEDGEWIEVYNASADALDLAGLMLADDGVDGGLAAFDGDSTLQPGKYAVFCAQTQRAANGGVRCDGSYLYQTFGGGFALSNEGDEAELLLDGQALDSMSYTASQVPAGQSLGRDPACLASGESAPRCWCAQPGVLSGGDAGNPGEENDGC